MKTHLAGLDVDDFTHAERCKLVISIDTLIEKTRRSRQTRASTTVEDNERQRKRIDTYIGN